MLSLTFLYLESRCAGTVPRVDFIGRQRTRAQSLHLTKSSPNFRLGGADCVARAPRNASGRNKAEVLCLV
jgi:hypothetical protein